MLRPLVRLHGRHALAININLADLAPLIWRELNFLAEVTICYAIARPRCPDGALARARRAGVKLAGHAARAAPHPTSSETIAGCEADASDIAH
jgi:hypothetical protein